MEIAHNGIKSKELAQQIQSWYQTGGGLACVDLFALLVALQQEEHQCEEGVTLKTICATRSHYEDLDKYQRIQVRKQIHNLMDKAKRRNYVERLSCDEPIFKLTQRGLAFIATALARRAAMCFKLLDTMDAIAAMQLCAQTLAEEECGVDDPLDDERTVRCISASECQHIVYPGLRHDKTIGHPLHQWMIRCQGPSMLAAAH